MSDLPDHHKRYATAWSLYQDPDLSKESKKILENEMDSAQNHFGWFEFQVFKKTLPGFVVHWESQKKEAEATIERLRKRYGIK